MKHASNGVLGIQRLKPSCGSCDDLAATADAKPGLQHNQVTHWGHKNQKPAEQQSSPIQRFQRQTAAMPPMTLQPRRRPGEHSATPLGRLHTYKGTGGWPLGKLRQLYQLILAREASLAENR